MLAAAAGIAAAADPQQTESWNILTQALHAGGPDQASAFGMLGAIGSAESRAVVEATLRGDDIKAIGLLAAGLTPEQCAFYLPDLGKAAGAPGGGPAALSILDAIARARSADAAGVLAGIADSAGVPTAGVAFGLLERMGDVAAPFLITAVTTGRSAWSRETAVSTLLRMRSAGEAAAFRSALHDTDDRVRTAASVALAWLGDPEGKPQLEAAAANPSSDYQTDAVVGLAILGQSGAFERLEGLVASPDEAVRGRTAWAIARSGSVNLKQFAYRMGFDRQPVFRNMLAERLLDPGDPRDVAVLQAMIADGDEMSQLVAARRLLGTNGSGPAEQVVAKSLGSGNEAVRALAIETASSRQELRPVVARWLSSPDPAVQVAALSAIADLHQGERFAEVALYLPSDVRPVSAAAARALVALDPGAAKAALEAGLTSPRSHVRIHSAAMLLALAAHGQPR
jgi:HEAT repeat protein